MSSGFITLSKKEVVASGSIVASPKDEIFIAPFVDSPNYRLEIRVIFHEKLDKNNAEIDTYIGKDDDDGTKVFVLEIKRIWNGGTPSAHTGVQVAQTETELVLANLVVRPIGIKDDYALSVEYTIYNSPKATL